MKNQVLFFLAVLLTSWTCNAENSDPSIHIHNDGRCDFVATSTGAANVSVSGTCKDTGSLGHHQITGTAGEKNDCGFVECSAVLPTVGRVVCTFQTAANTCKIPEAARTQPWDVVTD